MFLERVAVFTLQIRAKLRDIFNYLLREIDSQLGQIFFTCSLLFLTALLFYVWITPFGIWLQITFTVFCLVSILLCISAIYFLVKRKRIRLDTLEVYSLNNNTQEKFQNINVEVIPLTQDQVQAIYKRFSGKYMAGTYKSFQLLTQLKPISAGQRLTWIDLSPKRPKQVNRQTLLEFLSHLFINFKNLDNQQIILFVEQYFNLTNPTGTQQHLSTKNVSDWRTNQAIYLKDIADIFKSI